MSGMIVFQVIVNDLLVDVLRPDVYDEQLLLDDLQPTREYHFKSVVGNAVDEAVPLYANATTPIGKTQTHAQTQTQTQTHTHTHTHTNEHAYMKVFILFLL